MSILVIFCYCFVAKKGLVYDSKVANSQTEPLHSKDVTCAGTGLRVESYHTWGYVDLSAEESIESSSLKIVDYRWVTSRYTQIQVNTSDYR